MCDTLRLHSRNGTSDMNFTSVEYLLLLASVVLLCALLPSARAQNLLLLAASYGFYALWDWRLLGLLLVTTLLHYAVSDALRPTAAHPRAVLYAMIGFNLGVLAVFGRFNFFLDTVALPNSPALNILLPVGIGFYSLRLIAWCVDLYRGEPRSRPPLVDFALYMAFFPYILAGPIERAGAMLPQFAKRRSVSPWQVESGLILLLIGLFKKLVIANTAALLIPVGIFTTPFSYAPDQVLIAVYLFTLLLYADFAGYSDIARGSARLLGIELMANFRQPYFAQTVTDFWNRWHISLSLWLRMYVFLPLSRRLLKHIGSEPAFVTAMMVTMLLSGMWHGAAWTFILWGALHGVYQVIGRPLRMSAQPLLRHPVTMVRGGVIALRILLTFHLVLVAWVLFAAGSPAAVAGIFQQMLTAVFAGGGGAAGALARAAALLWMVLLLIDIGAAWGGDADFAYHLPLVVRTALYGVLLSGLIVFAEQPYVPFVYFQF